MTWPNIATALMIAAHVWGPAPCGTPHIVWATAPENTNFVGWSFPKTADCAIYLDINHRFEFTVNPESRCSVIVHEWGHLAGQKHSADPRNVMFEKTLPTPYWRCVEPKWRRGWPLST